MKKNRPTPLRISVLSIIMLGTFSGLLPAQDSRPIAEPPAVESELPGHTGPNTPSGLAGPARFVAPLLAGFDSAQALEHVAFIDRFYREPGNDGFEAVVDRILSTLRAAGFGTKEHLVSRNRNTLHKSPPRRPERKASRRPHIQHMQRARSLP